MGELHLEIVEERLQRVYGVECELGELQVAYREGLAGETGTTGMFAFLYSLPALDLMTCYSSTRAYSWLLQAPCGYHSKDLT